MPAIPVSMSNAPAACSSFSAGTSAGVEPALRGADHGRSRLWPP
jgi:hypothetical protein